MYCAGARMRTPGSARNDDYAKKKKERNGTRIKDTGIIRQMGNH
jgi:hypothetical protein